VAHPDLDTAVATRLRAIDQRYTAGRRALIGALANGHGPLTINELLTVEPGLAQSSAYRNLAVLEHAGVVHRVMSTDEFARFELAEDLTDHHHHHLICTVCGAVADFTVSAAVERALGTDMRRVALATGFAVDHHRLDLIGRCPSCVD
jgi:Fe2+ or Zn2+ uptake regulation protein